MIQELRIKVRIWFSYSWPDIFGCIFHFFLQKRVKLTNYYLLFWKQNKDFVYIYKDLMIIYYFLHLNMIDIRAIPGSKTLAIYCATSLYSEAFKPFQVDPLQEVGFGHTGRSNQSPIYLKITCVLLVWHILTSEENFYQIVMLPDHAPQTMFDFKFFKKKNTSAA